MHWTPINILWNIAYALAAQFKRSVPVPPELPPPPVKGWHVAGDSIALGVATLSGLKGRVTYDAKVGAPTWDIAQRVNKPNQAVYIISAGSNQPTDYRNPAALVDIRERITNLQSKVIWILPMSPKARASVCEIAAAHSDKVVTFIPSRDGVHPKSYSALALAILAAAES